MVARALVRVAVVPSAQSRLSFLLLYVPIFTPAAPAPVKNTHRWQLGGHKPLPGPGCLSLPCLSFSRLVAPGAGVQSHPAGL